MYAASEQCARGGIKRNEYGRKGKRQKRTDGKKRAELEKEGSFNVVVMKQSVRRQSRRISPAY